MLKQSVVDATDTSGIEGTNEYGYDAAQKRAWKKITRSGTVAEDKVYVYAGPNVVAEYDKGSAATAPNQEYIYSQAVDSLVMIVRSGGTQKLNVTRNQQWSVSALTDSSSGSVLERYSYDEFGKRTILAPDGVTVRGTSNFNNPYGYTSRRHDEESGLMYFRARYYDCGTGEFASQDPLEYVDGMSLYRGYFSIDAVDPEGLQRAGARRPPTMPMVRPPRLRRPGSRAPKNDPYTNGEYLGFQMVDHFKHNQPINNRIYNRQLKEFGRQNYLRYQQAEAARAVKAGENLKHILNNGASRYPMPSLNPVAPRQTCPPRYPKPEVNEGKEGMEVWHHYLPCDKADRMTRPGVIQANARSRVYVTQLALSPKDASSIIFIGFADESQAECMVVFTAPKEWRNRLHEDPSIRPNGWYHHKSVRENETDPIRFVYVGKNPYFDGNLPASSGPTIGSDR